MIRLGPLPFQRQLQLNHEKSESDQQRKRSCCSNSTLCIVLVVLYLYCVSSVSAVGPHCNQAGHGPEDIIMATGRINPKYTWYKRGHKTYVPVVMDPTYSHKEHSVIVGGLNEIQEKTCVEFDIYDDEHSLHGKDYVYITRRTKRGCWSFIGRIGRGKQEIGLPPGCITHRTAMHEMMHALGFRHEHVRHDRDDYILIFWGNIKPGRETNFQKRGNDLSVGPYDYASIMHYDRKAFSSNNQDTIRPLKHGVKIGVRQKMSHWDAKKINIMYGCSAGGGRGGHLSWNPEHDHEHDHDDPDLEHIDDIHPALPRNASSSPPQSAEIEVAYDELDYDPAVNPSPVSGRSGPFDSHRPQQRSGPGSSFDFHGDDDDADDEDRNNDNHIGPPPPPNERNHFEHEDQRHQPPHRDYYQPISEEDNPNYPLNGFSQYESDNSYPVGQTGERTDDSPDFYYI